MPSVDFYSKELDTRFSFYAPTETMAKPLLLVEQGPIESYEYGGDEAEEFVLVVKDPAKALSKLDQIYSEESTINGIDIEVMYIHKDDDNWIVENNYFIQIDQTSTNNYSFAICDESGENGTSFTQLERDDLRLLHRGIAIGTVV